MALCLICTNVTNKKNYSVVMLVASENITYLVSVQRINLVFHIIFLHARMLHSFLTLSEHFA